MYSSSHAHKGREFPFEIYHYGAALKWVSSMQDVRF